MKEEKLSYLKKLSILLVEDEEELLMQMNTVLSIFFKTVYCAKDGIEAYNIYSKFTIDMIMTDYVLPNMSGYELCKKIRKNNSDIPIVLMSNHSDREKLLNVIPLSLSQYLVKPINYETLTKTLIEIVETRQNNICEFYPLTSTIQYNTINKELTDGEKQIHLSKSEIILLELFIANEGRILLSQNIEYYFDDQKFKSQYAIKSIIYRLRKKIGKNIITNKPGVGYTFIQDSNLR